MRAWPRRVDLPLSNTGHTTADRGASAPSPPSGHPSPRDGRRAPAADEGRREEGPALAEVAAAFRWLAAVESELDDEAAGEIRRRRAAVESAASQSHYTLAVLGRDVRARTHLLNDLIGEAVIDPARRDRAGAAIRFRHGSPLGYRARFADGRVEDFAELVPDRSAGLAENVAHARGRFEEAQASHAAIRARLEQARRAFEAGRSELASAEAKLEQVETLWAEASRSAERARAETGAALTNAQGRVSSVPGYLRRRPPRWALWAWAGRALAGGRHRQAVAQSEALSRRAARFDDERSEAEAEAQRLGDESRLWQERCASLRAACENEARRCAALENEEHEHRARLRDCERQREDADAELGAFVDERRERFATRVRALTEAHTRGQIESLQIDLETLPPHVEVIDVGGADHAMDLQRVWELVGREADGCAVAGSLPREAELLFGGAIRSATPEVLACRLYRARVLRATRQAVEACKAARHSLETTSVRASEQVRRRVEALQKEHEAATRRLEGGLARARAEVVPRAVSALSQAGNHIEWELERLSAKWLSDVRSAETLAALRSALERIESEAIEAIPAVARGARALVVSTLSGVVADLVPALDDGADSPPVAPPRFSELDVDPFPSDLRRAMNVAPSRLGAHLQSLAKSRTACEEALKERVDDLRRRAVATVLQWEPQTAENLQNALAEIAHSLQQAHELRHQRALAAARTDADDRDRVRRDELREELAALLAKMDEHARALARRL